MNLKLNDVKNIYLVVANWKKQELKMEMFSKSNYRLMEDKTIINYNQGQHDMRRIEEEEFCLKLHE